LAIVLAVIFVAVIITIRLLAYYNGSVNVAALNARVGVTTGNIDSRCLICHCVCRAENIHESAKFAVTQDSNNAHTRT
jgi:hypothetical protein